MYVWDQAEQEEKQAIGPRELCRHHERLLRTKKWRGKPRTIESYGDDARACLTFVFKEAIERRGLLTSTFDHCYEPDDLDKK